MEIKQFQHQQAAHCESGVLSSMLTNSGLPMSEPMAFGLANALAFAYIPLIKISGMPLIAYRMPPGRIIKGLQKRLGLRMHYSRYKNPVAGMQALNNALDQRPFVGMQTSVYWLPYFPEDMRFHFNAHNLLVYGREGDSYAISDPVFEEPVSCAAEDLQRARFAKGALAARGFMYYPEQVPSSIDWPTVIPAAIRANFRVMNKAPLPVIGIRGIRYLANSLLKLSRKKSRDKRYFPFYLGHIVRMQEEIGTGGAGFRFIYASFLKECADMLDSELFAEASEKMTEAGDTWREFALIASKMCKNRKELDADSIYQALNHCADQEQLAWQLLARV